MSGWTGDARVRQVAIAVAIVGGVSCGVVVMLGGWRSVPGVAGEWLGMLAGILSSPFFLEPSLVMLGILSVLVVNAIRRRREGDDFVSHEQLATRARTRATGHPQPADGARASARILPADGPHRHSPQRNSRNP